MMIMCSCSFFSVFKVMDINNIISISFLATKWRYFTSFKKTYTFWNIYLLPIVYTLISKTRFVHEKDKGTKWREVIYFHDILQIGSCIIDAPFVFCSAFHVFRNDRGSEQGQMGPIWMVEVGKDHLMETKLAKLIMNDRGHPLRLGTAQRKQGERELVEEVQSLKVCIITARVFIREHFQVSLWETYLICFVYHHIFYYFLYCFLIKYHLFLGTLNPALQDRNGQPKRDITTIIHILNDLLCAQYKNYSPGTTTENQTTAPNTHPSSASHTTSANPSSKTSARSTESHKSDNISKHTKSGTNPSCSCSNDILVGANPPLNQKSTLKAANETRSSLPTKRGNIPFKNWILYRKYKLMKYFR